LIKQQAYKAAHDLKHMVTASRKYTYNAMNQLIRQEGSQRGVQQYHYSNRQQLTGWQADFTNTQTLESGQYQFDPASQLIGLEEQQTDKRYAYDQRGNHIHQWRGKDHAIQTQYRYSAQNELIEVVEQKRHIQTQVHFQYDALGRRIQKEVTQRSVCTGEITSHYKHDYLWMGDVILEDRCTELLANSHPAKQAANTDKVVSIGSNNNADTGELQSNDGVILYLHEPSAFRPLAQIRSEQTGEGEQTELIYYYHLDHIGTPLELTDEQGRIVWQANYTGFGQARIINSGITNLIRYPGQYEDSEIGLHYNRFRYYDPSSGQYTQQDPIGLMGGEQLSQYVADPVNWVDVLGLQKDCPLDWEAVVPKRERYKGQNREDHVRLHNSDNSVKPEHGVFYGDGVDVTNQAWSQAQKLKIKPDSDEKLFVPMGKLTGRAVGQKADTGELFYGVHIKLVPGIKK
jgi:RHS repeat-associated protein